MLVRRLVGFVVMGLALGSSAASAGCATEVVTTSSGDPAGATPEEGTGEDGSGDATGATDNGRSSGGTTTPPAQPSRPGCAQTTYTETLPSSTSLSGIAFSSAKASDYLVAALAKRYPIGKALVDGALASPLAAQQGNCVDRFLSDKSSADAVLRGATTVVHECGHIFDLGSASGNDSTYIIRPGELELTCSEGDTTTRGGKTFARSLIKTDGQYTKRKACGGSPADGCDMYADIYLDGNPTDATFDSGDQGYNSVLEEATQYVNSLASALAFKESFDGIKQSERDGILTFLWYIERYLAMARTNYPDAYALLSGDACWRQATLSVWDRGWFYLNATKGMDSLQLDADAIESLVKDPTLLAEIDALRELECK